MRFKYPGGDVALCTGLWIIIGGLGLAVGVTTRDLPWYLVACAIVAVPALGIWFQIRTAGYVFAAFNALLAAVGLVALVLGGAVSLKPAVTVAGMIWAAVVSAKWAHHLEPPPFTLDNDDANPSRDTYNDN